jgi:ABC-type phosphate transport system permease subunit
MWKSERRAFRVLFIIIIIIIIVIIIIIIIIIFIYATKIFYTFLCVSTLGRFDTLNGQSGGIDISVWRSDFEVWEKPVNT